MVELDEECMNFIILNKCKKIKDHNLKLNKLSEEQIDYKINHLLNIQHNNYMKNIFLFVDYNIDLSEIKNHDQVNTDYGFTIDIKLYDICKSIYELSYSYDIYDITTQSCQHSFIGKCSITFDLIKIYSLWNNIIDNFTTENDDFQLFPEKLKDNLFFLSFFNGEMNFNKCNMNLFCGNKHLSLSYNWCIKEEDIPKMIEDMKKLIKIK